MCFAGALAGEQKRFPGYDGIRDHDRRPPIQEHPVAKLQSSETLLDFCHLPALNS